MTAIVAVLNKHAVAVAADSAATISSSSNQKVFNTANKVFTLSKYRPVSVAIHNNSELIGVPWEIVIKEYRRHLGEKSFPTLKEYVGDFFNFLSAKSYFTKPEVHRQHLLRLMTSFLGDLIYGIRGNNLAFVGAPLSSGLSDSLKKAIQDSATFPCVPTFADITKDDFENELKNEIDSIEKDLANGLQVTIDRKLLVQALFQVFTRGFSQQAFSGVVITGYGDDEIFPSLYSYNVQHVIDNKLAIKEDKTTTVTVNDDIFIVPFAQADVMATLIDGIAPVVKDIYFSGLTDPIKKLLKDIENQVRPVNNKLANNIEVFINKGLEKYIDSYISRCDQQRKESYTDPLIRSVAMLEKEDLADFAESLISITSVKRKMNLNEQNTVGGPIDVLVMSKGDGAIWMKRKHYFDPNLNPNFFNTYLKH